MKIKDLLLQKRFGLQVEKSLPLFNGDNCLSGEKLLSIKDELLKTDLFSSVSNLEVIDYPSMKDSEGNIFDRKTVLFDDRNYGTNSIVGKCYLLSIHLSYKNDVSIETEGFESPNFDKDNIVVLVSGIFSTADENEIPELF